MTLVAHGVTRTSRVTEFIVKSKTVTPSEENAEENSRDLKEGKGSDTRPEARKGVRGAASRLSLPSPGLWAVTPPVTMLERKATDQEKTFANYLLETSRILQLYIP